MILVFIRLYVVILIGIWLCFRRMDGQRWALKVTELWLKFTLFAKDIVICELKDICRRTDVHELYDWSQPNIPFRKITRDYQDLARSCLPNPNDITTLEKSFDPMVFLNILSQDKLFPKVINSFCL